MKTLLFNFHGIAGIQVHTQDAGAAAFFAAEYAHHRVEMLAPHIPRVVLNFGLQPPPGLASTRHTHKVLARWAYSIELSGNQVILYAAGNRFAVPMIHHMLVHSSLRYLVSDHNTLLLHSGAVALNGRSIVFTGRGGAGKTTTTSLLLSSRERNWALHADDFTFIRPGQGTLAYLTRAHLYRDLLTWIPDLHTRISTSERFRLEVFGRLRQWSRERLKWPVRIALDRLWPRHDLCQAAAPAALVLLRRSGVSDPALTPIRPDDAVVGELLEMNFYEARHFRTLLAKNCDTATASGLMNGWQERERQTLADWLQQVPVYELHLPGQRLPRDYMSGRINGLFSSLIDSGAGGDRG